MSASALIAGVTASLTRRQQEILDFIRQTTESMGVPPTRAEIAKAFKFSSHNAAAEHLRALAKKGVLHLEPGIARGIRIDAPSGLPLIGSVAAGSPILAAENVQGHINFDKQLFSPAPDYLLRVRGLSMSGIGIMEGDLLAVHRTREARNGQIVVARLHEDVTVKRFQKKGQVVELLPENPDFEPIVVDLSREELTIEGIAVGLIRSGGLQGLN